MSKGQQRTHKFIGFDSPCLDCAERHPCCHDECEEFKAFRSRISKRKWAKANHYVE